MFKSKSSHPSLRKKSLKKGGSTHSLTSTPPLSPTVEQTEAKDMEKLKFSWHRSETLDYGMFCGQSAVWGSTVYFKNGGTSEVLEYSSSTHSWTKLNHCPYCGFSLVVIAGLVTAIGGYNSRKQEDSNKLVSLMDGKWVEYYPPMPTCRYYTTAVVTPKKVIVAGGSVKNNVRVHTVEVMDIETKEWSKVASLPKALSSSCSVVYGDNAFLIGGFDAHGRPSSTVLTCSVNELIQSAFPPTERENMTPIDMSGTPWRTLPDLPVTYSHCTIVNGHLVTVGGMKASKRPTGDIFHYDPSTSSWEVIGGVPTPRYCSVTVTLPSKELIVVGGLSGGNNTDCINICEAASF